MEFDLNSFIRQGQNLAENSVKQIPVNMLVPYHNHKFQMYTGERLDDMVESIRTNGVLTPIVVQPLDNGTYEILIGHNRWNASKLAGKPAVPAIIKTGLTEDEAEMFCVESNLIQRSFSNLLISEQAAVIAMRHNKMFSEKKRRDIISELNALSGDDAGTKKPWNTTKQVGEEYSMSRNSVARLIRINMLNDKLKSAIDNGQIPVRAGVELSFLSEETQQKVSEYTDTIRIDMNKSKALRNAADDAGNVSSSDIIRIMTSNEKQVKSRLFKIRENRIIRFFSDDVSDSEVEETIEKALEYYFSGAAK